MAKIQLFLAFSMVSICSVSEFMFFGSLRRFGSETVVMVFAGHAGTDVAIYSSKNLFQNLRNSDSYKAGQIEKVIVVVGVVVVAAFYNFLHESN